MKHVHTCLLLTFFFFFFSVFICRPFSLLFISQCSHFLLKRRVGKAQRKCIDLKLLQGIVLSLSPNSTPPQLFSSLEHQFSTVSLWCDTYIYRLHASGPYFLFVLPPSCTSLKECLEDWVENTQKWLAPTISPSITFCYCEGLK